MGTARLSQAPLRLRNSVLLTNAMPRPHISKVFLDSRYAQPDSVTFLIPGESILVEPSSRVWLGEFTAVASWDTLDESNNSFAVVEARQYRTVLLPTRPRDLESLRAAIEEGLNDAPREGMGTYTVSRVSTGNGGSTF